MAALVVMFVCLLIINDLITTGSFANVDALGVGERVPWLESSPFLFPTLIDGIVALVLCCFSSTLPVSCANGPLRTVALGAFVLGFFIVSVPVEAAVLSTPAVYLAGVSCIVFCQTVLFIGLMELLSTLPLALIKRIALAAMAIHVVVMLAIGSLEFNQGGWVIAALVLVVVLCWRYAWTRRDTFAAEDSLGIVSLKGSSVLVVALGFAVIVVAVTFLSPDAASVEQGLDYYYSSLLLTRVPSIVIIALLLLVVDDDDYTVGMKLVETVALVAFILYGTSHASLSRLVSLFAYTLLDMIPLIAVLELSTRVDVKPVRLLCGFLAVFGIAQAVGIALSLLASNLPSSAAGERGGYVGELLAMAVVAVSLWVLSTRHMGLFFWGDMGHRRSQDLSECSAGLSSADIVSERYGLSQREADVLVFLAQGRSAAFIAEEMFLSPSTVRSHIQRIYMKCGVHSKQDLLSLIQAASEEG
ncbi:helix-turn-helix transcriptional regulator [Adlercreutzia shanghongiae]|uniref:Helix-turn-helix transcriptional regulator n=1 Tax=Adlercreutzia shanghongiae TaxID=3111773 RepID=A0ABU6IYD9_9ACTN|nr:helix-turn-helix transcriptional regulator [Adlercreutzia sp. R22]MEC4294872.1 helix-turn-helix transcriptional regulator [Adlercreutzia sp. R22]